ncbi:MAG TPA: DUF2786 domain-containing protein [Patescibacteria group bacterium]|nr:DUF2786 domain-containing protein [Patescibacteria group bacterium]
MDLDKLKTRIQGLRAKTVENGCTEQEALLAAAKVAEMLDQYDLSLTDVELSQEQCERGVIDTNRKQRQPISLCLGAIGEFCDCKPWLEKDPSGKVRYVFFGLKPGVEMAHYVYDIINAAMLSEWETHRKAQRFIRYADDVRGSFLMGMAVSIAEKLTAMKAERDAVNRAVSGRDLVVVKQAVIEAEFAKLDMQFRQSRASSRKVAPDAFAAGQEAGRGVSFHRALKG